MIILGIDPDLHNTAIAFYDTSLEEVMKVDIVQVDLTYRDAEAAFEMSKALYNALTSITDVDIFSKIGCLVVENQSIYIGSKIPPQDIVHLGQVAGSAVAGCVYLDDMTQYVAKILNPTANKWKGSVPKPIHQARILNKLKWACQKTSTYAYPTDPPIKLKKRSQWKHAVDAIGLALWGASKFA